MSSSPSSKPVLTKIDVVVLTETKNNRTGSEIMGNYIHLLSGLKKYERAKRGVSILINMKWKGSIKNWESIDEGILKLDMNVWGYKLTIIGIYATSVFITFIYLITSSILFLQPCTFHVPNFKVLFLSLSRLSPSDFRGLVFGFLAFLVF